MSSHLFKNKKINMDKQIHQKQRDRTKFERVESQFSQSKKKGKYQESIQSNTTPDPGYQWESDNFSIRHHKREVSPLPASDHKVSINRRTRKHNKNMTDITNDPQKKCRLEWSVKA